LFANAVIPPSTECSPGELQVGVVSISSECGLLRRLLRVDPGLLSDAVKVASEDRGIGVPGNKSETGPVDHFDNLSGLGSTLVDTLVSAGASLSVVHSDPQILLNRRQ
jgi:hypothetical protein